MNQDTTITGLDFRHIEFDLTVAAYERATGDKDGLIRQFTETVEAMENRLADLISDGNRSAFEAVKDASCRSKSRVYDRYTAEHCNEFHGKDGSDFTDHMDADDARFYNDELEREEKAIRRDTSRHNRLWDKLGAISPTIKD